MIEDVLNQMKRLIEDHFDAERDKQNGKYGAPMVESIKTIMESDDDYEATGLPAVILEPLSAEFIPSVSSKKDAAHIIAIGVVVDIANMKDSKKVLRRTMRAIENVMEIHGNRSASPDGPIIDYTTEDVDYNAELLDIDPTISTAKAGILLATVKERQDSYVSTQV